MFGKLLILLFMGKLPPNIRLKISRVADQTEWELRKFKKILKNPKLKYDELLTAVVEVECVPRNPLRLLIF